MYTHTTMSCKEAKIKPEVCNIVAVKELNASAFAHFKDNLLDDYDFIRVHAEELHGSEDGTQCLLVLSEGYPYGILVNSEGSAYARYSGIMPHAREAFNAHLDSIADYCIREGTTNTEDGNWTISYDEIYEHFGTVIDMNNGIGDVLLEKLKQRNEVDIAIATEDEFEMMYHLEHCPQCQQGGLAGAFSLLSLIGCNLDDVHLICEGETVDPEFVPHLDDTTLTEEGKREFADVLSAHVSRMYGCRKGMTVELSGCSMERVRMLSKVLRGDCTLAEYHRYVFPKPGEVRTEMRTLTQEDIDIAAAKHTLWRLDQPEGIQADFRHCDLYGLDLSGKDFNGAVFADCRMKNCRAVDTEFCSASFCNSEIRDCEFDIATAENSDWTDAKIADCSFKQATLTASNFTRAVISGSDVDDAGMRFCCLADTKFPDTYIEGADTHGSVYSLGEWDADTGMVIRQ